MRIILSIYLLCTLATAQTAIRPGEITADVVTLKDSNQHYAVYVPSTYAMTRRWPVILAFDPGGNGRHPVEQFRQAAEKYGYIVVGSHNSRNGPIDPSMAALRALWDEVQSRFAVDIRRMYTSGFSGGARIATLSAILCNDCMAGVIACGAGFPSGYRPSAKTKFAYFSTVGTQDFNFSELAALQNDLDHLGVANVRRVFDGRHQWAPPEILTEAVEWMELQAMRRDLRPRDDAFISSQLSSATKRAQELEQPNASAALRQYKFIAATFEGLADTAAATAKIGELEHLPAVVSARKREAEQLKREQALNQQLGDLAAKVFNNEHSESGDLDSRTALRQFRSRLDISASPEEAQMNARVLGNMFAIFAEEAQQYMRKKEFLSAALCFDIASDVRTQPGTRYNASRAYALGGDKKNALRSLREAVTAGFNDRARIEGDEDLKSIRGMKEYRELMASLQPATNPK